MRATAVARAKQKKAVRSESKKAVGSNLIEPGVLHLPMDEELLHEQAMTTNVSYQTARVWPGPDAEVSEEEEQISPVPGSDIYLG